MNIKINILGFIIIMVLFGSLGLYLGYLAGRRDATELYRKDYAEQELSIDSVRLRIDSYKIKQDTLELLINKKCNEGLKRKVDSIKAKNSKRLLQNNSLSGL